MECILEKDAVGDARDNEWIEIMRGFFCGLEVVELEEFRPQARR